MFFDYGFGPFRWVCTSCDPHDLELTDRLATEVLEAERLHAPADICHQLEDNIHWIKEAGKNHLVVGSQARILYADCEGRTKIALAFNDAVRSGQLHGPVVLGRDHHDVSAPTPPSVRRATSTTGRASVPTWPSRTSSATASAEPPG
jgi:urocanate hydratase